MLRSFARIVIFYLIIAYVSSQPDINSLEGASYPDVTVSGAGKQTGLLSSGLAPSLYQVVAVASAPDNDHGLHNQQQQLLHSKHGRSETSVTGHSGTGSSSSRSSSTGSSTSGQGRSNGAAGSRSGRGSSSKSSDKTQRQQSKEAQGSVTDPAAEAEAAEAEAAAAGTVGVESVRPTTNPAANAPLVSATPLFGSPAVGSVIPNRYVVFFHGNVSSTKVGLNRLHKHVKKELLKDSPSGSQSGLRVSSIQSAFAFKVTASLGDDSSSSSSDTAGVAAAAAPPSGLSVASTPTPGNRSNTPISSSGSSSSSSSGSDGGQVAAVTRPKGAVLEVPEGLDADLFVAAVQSADDVNSIYRDRVISITQGPTPTPQCAPSRALAGYTTRAPTLRWRNCKLEGTTIYWFGERCGANLSKTRWLGIYALNITTSQVVPGCLRYRKKNETDNWNRSYMGGCGVAPTAAAGLPTAVCPDGESAGCIPSGKLSNFRLSLNQPVTCSNTASTDITFVGKRCGPGLGFVQWTGVSINNPSSSAQVGWQAPNWQLQQQQQQQQWLTPQPRQWRQPAQQHWQQPGSSPQQQQQQQQPMPGWSQPIQQQQQLFAGWQQSQQQQQQQQQFGGWQQQQMQPQTQPVLQTYLQGVPGQQLQQQQPPLGWQQQQQQMPGASPQWQQQQQQLNQPGMWQQQQQVNTGWPNNPSVGWQQQQQLPGWQAPQQQPPQANWLDTHLGTPQAACTFKASATDLKFNSDWLGSCGVSPLNIPMPNVVCTSDQLESGVGNLMRPAFPPKSGDSQAGHAGGSGDDSKQEQQQQGGANFPPKQPVPAPSAAPPSAAPAVSLPPAQPPPAAPLLPETPAAPPAAAPAGEAEKPTSPGVPTMPMAEKEFLPTGVQLIEAGYGGRVPDLAAAPVQGIVVAVVDTGVDKSHPDLNVVGGMNMVADEPHLSFSDDSHGHGTHVAGTIGAKNQGKGIVGVAPGVGIYGIRVLRADGNGAFSDLVRTYDHLLKEGRKLGIRVVNLSLSGSGTAEDVECQYISQLIAQGMTVVTAAGNSGVSLRQEVPAACPGTLVVTAISDNDGTVGASDKPPAWSNYLPLPDADNIAARMLAAPGDQITSTYPMDRGGFNGYARMSGTSMACPHVSGIVALCYASDICGSNSTTEYPAIVGPSIEHVEATASYRYTNDPLTSPLPDKYYGYLAWARTWWAT